MEHSNFDPLFILKRTALKLFDPIDIFALKLDPLTNSEQLRGGSEGFIIEFAMQTLHAYGIT